MRKLLNTLHVMTQGAYLHRDGETVAIKVGEELKLRVPVHTLEGLVCWGQVIVQSAAAGAMLRTRRRHLVSYRAGKVSGACDWACLRQCAAAEATISDGR